MVPGTSTGTTGVPGYTQCTNYSLFSHLIFHNDKIAYRKRGLDLHVIINCLGLHDIIIMQAMISKS